MVNEQAAQVAQISLVFGKGNVPDADAIRRLPEHGKRFFVTLGLPPSGDPDMLELLADGLTFDMLRRGAGRELDLQDCGYRFDLPEEFSPHSQNRVLLQPGPHLAGGASMVPVVRGMLGLVVHLCQLDSLMAVGWHPSRCWIGPRYFASMAKNWLNGGVFPVRGLIGLAPVADGALQSEGTAFFVGQEVRVEPELMGDEANAANIAVRLIDHLVENGPCAEPSQMIGPKGRVLHIAPSSNQRIVRVWGG